MTILHFLKLIFINIVLSICNYVTHLRRHCNGTLDFPCPHRFFGESGMSTRHRFDDQFQQLIEYKPKVVFIILGGNDIRISSDPEDIFWRLVNVTESLYSHEVETVLMSEIVERGKFPPWTGLTRCKFNTCKRKINKMLKTHFGEHFV